MPILDSRLTTARALRPGSPLVPISLSEGRGRSLIKLGFLTLGVKHSLSYYLQTLHPDQLTWQKTSFWAREVAYPFIHISAFAWFWLSWGKTANSVPYFDSLLASARALRPGLPLFPISLNEGGGRPLVKLGFLAYWVKHSLSNYLQTQDYSIWIGGCAIRAKRWSQKIWSNWPNLRWIQPIWAVF